MGRKAPWTLEEVENIKQHQLNKMRHALTCAEHSDQPLAVTTEAIMCPLCDYRQTWVPTTIASSRTGSPDA